MQPDIPAPLATKKVLQHRADTQLKGIPLLLVRLAWGSIAMLTLCTLIMSIVMFPAYFKLMPVPCHEQVDCNSRLSATAIQQLQQLGVSPVAFALFMSISFFWLPSLVWIVTGLVLARRKSDDWMALLSSALLITWGASFMSGFGVVVKPFPLASTLAAVVSAISQFLLYPFFSLFPNGRFVPRWIVWLLPLWLVLTIYQTVGDSTGLTIPFLGKVETYGFIFPFTILLAAAIYRYIRVSTPIQRQQTKWLLYGIVVEFLIADIGSSVLSLLIPALNSDGSLPSALNGALWSFLFLCIPVAIGIALTRYRLWDIDIIIRRTLVYGLLTVLLALLYLGVVLILQRTLSGFLAGGYQIATALSTLLIAALFQPLRGRIQKSIDRRFYHQKYDAARTLAAFSENLRQEVDLAQLHANILAVVEETMQPTHASLWLFQPARAPQVEAAPSGPLEPTRQNSEPRVARTML